MPLVAALSECTEAEFMFLFRCSSHINNKFYIDKLCITMILIEINNYCKFTFNHHIV